MRIQQQAAVTQAECQTLPDWMPQALGQPVVHAWKTGVEGNLQLQRGLRRVDTGGEGGGLGSLKQTSQFQGLTATSLSCKHSMEVAQLNTFLVMNAQVSRAVTLHPFDGILAGSHRIKAPKDP